MEDSCPLCKSTHIIQYHRDRSREYKQCSVCKLIFVPTIYHLSRCEEKNRYDLHENSPDHLGYWAYLNRFVVPFSEKLEPKSHGLDFGSGPYPLLSELMEKRGFKMEWYDPFYADTTGALQQTYDFVTCTEVVEHFREPAIDWELMIRLVKRGGWIGVMTNLVEGATSFPSWHYLTDKTHICFYSKATFRWLANRYALSVEFQDLSQIFMQTGH